MYFSIYLRWWWKGCWVNVNYNQLALTSLLICPCIEKQPTKQQPKLFSKLSFVYFILYRGKSIFQAISGHGCWTNINYHKCVLTLICKVFLKLYQVWWGCCIYETYNNPVLTLIFIYPYINDIICKIFFHTCHLFILCCIKQGIFQLFQVVVGLLD